MTTEQDEKGKEKKFLPPIKSKEFKLYWNKLINSVTERGNFREGHLKSLEILCTLYVEYDKLTKIITDDGYTYTASGRYGVQIKTRPEVTERIKILAEIRQYSRLLGVVLGKDEGPTDSGEDEWS